MARVLVVGAGLHGLIAAKTYLQVTGAYSRVPDEKSIYTEDVPPCFTTPASTTPGLLIVDSAADLGGTWASERLYPNLLSQNSYSLYEYSDLPLASAVPSNGQDDENGQFIPGWKINRYLHVWCKKWDLHRHLRLGWKVLRMRRLPSNEWSVDVSIISQNARHLTLVCDKLILATGLTSEPNIPDIPVFVEGKAPSDSLPRIHSKHVGRYCRETLGYTPIPSALRDEQKEKPPQRAPPRTVVIQGGAKSSFDFVHLFATLHQNSRRLGLNAPGTVPVQVHWVIRKHGAGASWMAPPTCELLNGDTVPSDQAASTRLVGMMTPCVYRVPKRLSFRAEETCRWRPQVEGTWWCRFVHGNALGRLAIRRFWKGVNRTIMTSTGYDNDDKMEKLRPGSDVIDCAASGGIANQPQLWETIRSPSVHVHRSDIALLTGPASSLAVHLDDGTVIPEVDLLIHATGWKGSAVIPFHPPSLSHTLGLASPLMDEGSPAQLEWDELDGEVESKMRSIFDSRLFQSSQTRPPPANTPYRLFRRMISPTLAAEGDRSFVVLGIVLSSTVAVVAEVQALWAAAFLTGGFDHGVGYQDPSTLALNRVGVERLKKSVSEDVVWGRLTGSGLDVDAIHYNDILLRDLGLNPYRMGGLWKELTATYGPSAYAGIVDEWMERHVN